MYFQCGEDKAQQIRVWSPRNALFPAETILLIKKSFTTITKATTQSEIKFLNFPFSVKNSTPHKYLSSKRKMNKNETKISNMINPKYSMLNIKDKFL